tara:strand:+ start:179 stop:469 length:291 start_codon:yes stop_codon:yes gene_type:complete
LLVVGESVAVDSYDDVRDDAVNIGDDRPTLALDYTLVTGGATLEFGANNNNDGIVVQFCFAAFRHYRQTTLIQVAMAFDLVAYVHYLPSLLVVYNA